MARSRSKPRDYTAAWDRIAAHVKAKAGWRCERCGEQHDKSTGHVLTVAHLDHEYGNQRFNLAALCQRCHLKYECRIHFRQGYMYPHSEWFIPHVAGWRRYIDARRREFPKEGESDG